MADDISASPWSGYLVLLVEDEMLLAEDLRQGLAELGVEVLGPASSVQRALELLDEGRIPDAAILDINIEGGLSFSLADVLRDRGIPFIFATGYDGDRIPEAYARVPRWEKPFDVERCVQLLLKAACSASASEPPTSTP